MNHKKKLVKVSVDTHRKIFELSERLEISGGKVVSEAVNLFAKSQGEKKNSEENI